MKTLTASVILSAFLLFSASSASAFSADDEVFLNKVQHDSFLYFMKEYNPQTGLIKDSSRPGSPCSLAAMGFGITALCIGESKGWIGKKDAYDRILRILHTFKYGVPQEHGFFYRFMDVEHGDRFMNSEVSSIDTAIFIAGALFAGEYFKGTPIEKAAKELYDAVDWPWMMNGQNTIAKGWVPEGGFLPESWDSYSEAMVLYALAIGSATHPIPKESWSAWSREIGSYKGYDVVYAPSGSLYTYQYSHAWIDFKQLFDGKINYFDNSVSAVKANKQFCIDNSSGNKTYGEDSWGLTACIGPDGYRNYGAKPGEALNDGTIAPSGMAGSIVFADQDALKGLKELYDKHGNFLYGEYGFKDAFNLDKEWWSEEYLACNLGIALVMIENYRTHMIWQRFMGLPAIQKWTSACLTKN